MAQSYTRQSTFADGDTITAALFNDEYNQLVNAFTYSSSSASSTGHRHDGTAGHGGNIHTIGDLDFLNKIVVDDTNNRWGFFVEVSSAAVEQIRLSDGVLAPVTDSDVDLGTSSLYWKDAYIDSITTTGNVSVGGNITVTGNATISGNLTFGDAATDTVAFSADVASNLLPSADNTYDIGASGSEWKDLYIDGTAYVDAINYNGTAITSTAAELNILDGVTSTAAELNILDGVTATTAELNIMDGVTATTAELNIMDGVTATTAEINTLDGITSTVAELNILDGVTSTAAEINLLDGVTSTTAELNILDGVTATAAEINLLDGVTSTTAELNILDGVTSTATELNIVDGTTTATATTLADADRVVVNDAGTMVQVALTDFETYFESALDTLSNVTTVGALNAGSITSGFGAIDNGSSAITTTGTVTYGSLSDGTITITAFVDEDDMSSDSATLVPTQQSVKAYVDAQILTEDTLAEMNDVNITTPADASLLFYDTTTSKWIDNVVSGDITIADTGVATIQANSVALSTDTTGDYVSTITAGTGLTSTGATSGEGIAHSLSVDASQTQITAVGTIGTGTWQGTAIADAYVANDLTISGGTVNNSVIGGTTPAAGTFTTLTANTSITGTLATAAQTNVTSVGTLSSLTVSGDLTVDTSTLKVDSTNNRVGVGNASPDVSLDVGSVTDAIHVPSGTTAQRPASPAAGYFRYNTTTGDFEGYTDAWGAIAGAGGTAPVVDTMTGDGSDTTLTLTSAPVNENATVVTIDGVVQHKDTYSVSSNTLTFSEAPPNGTAVECITWVNTTVNSALLVQDADGDTQIQVEESSDEDKIRFDTGGTERMVIDNSGMVLIGQDSGDAFNSDSMLRLQRTGDRVFMQFKTDADQNSGILFGDVDDDVECAIEYEPANKALTFSTGNNTEVLRIDTNQNVGIGTASPTVESGRTGLHIHDGTGPELHMTDSASGTTASDGAVLVFDNPNFYVSNKEAGPIQFWTNGSEKARLDSSGNLGIGTSSPSAMLHLYKATGSGALEPELIIENNHNTSSETDGAGRLTFYSDDSNNAGIPDNAWLGQVRFMGDDKDGVATEFEYAYMVGRARDPGSGTARKGGVSFFTRDGNSITETLTITEDSVGIGTTSPGDYNSAGQNLVVVDSGDSGITIAAGTSSDSSIMFADGTGGTAGYRGRVAYSHAADRMEFHTAASERMRITSDGNLTVGATTASHKIEAHSGGVASKYDSTTHITIRALAGANAIQYASANELVFYKIDTYPNSGATTTAKIATNGDFYTNDGTVHSLSDQRIKTNVIDLSDGLEIVNQLRPITYEYNNEFESDADLGAKDGVTRYGFIAQEVEAIAPQYVNQSEGKINGESVDDLRSLSQTKMIPMLVKSIQEQQEQIEELKQQINELRGN